VSRGGRSGRASARRSTLKSLNEARAKLDLLRGWWTTRTTIYVEPKDRPADDPNAYQRERRPEEYPENQEGYWASTVGELDEVIKSLTALRDQCAVEYWKTKEGR
jgi:hypothetical protein